MKKRGFTGVEVCIVLMIIGLLAAIAVPSFLKAKKEAEMKRYGIVAKEKAEKDDVQTLPLIKMVGKQSVTDDPNSPVIYVYYIAEQQYVLFTTSNSATLTPVGN